MSQLCRANRSFMYLGAFAALMLFGVSRSAYAETYKYLKCDANQVQGFGSMEGRNKEPASDIYHFAFDEQKQKFIEAKNSAWYAPGNNTSLCQVNISPAAINVSCQPDGVPDGGFFWLIKILRTSGTFEYTMGVVRDGVWKGVKTTGTCAPLPSDPLIPPKRLF